MWGKIAFTARRAVALAGKTKSRTVYIYGTVPTIAAAVYQRGPLPPLRTQPAQPAAVAKYVLGPATSYHALGRLIAPRTSDCNYTMKRTTDKQKTERTGQRKKEFDKEGKEGRKEERKKGRKGKRKKG